MSALQKSDMESPRSIICLQNADGSLNMAAVKHLEHQRAWSEIKKEVAKLPEVGRQ